MSAPTEASSLKRLIITPAISRLAFCMDCPADWQPIDLPQQTPNFDEPTNFFSLAVLMPVSATAPTLVSIGARPAYGDGSVYDWAQFAMNHHNITFTFTQLMPGNVNGYPAIRAMGSQPSEDGPMQLAMAFVEDGESFLQITAMAPAAAWPELEKLFESMINSFALLRPQGATVGLIPGQKPPLNDANFKALALSESSATLTDPDLKLKAYMRDNGIGLLPRAASVNEQERFAMMGLRLRDGSHPRALWLVHHGRWQTHARLHRRQRDSDQHQQPPHSGIDHRSGHGQHHARHAQRTTTGRASQAGYGRHTDARLQRPGHRRRSAQSSFHVHPISHRELHHADPRDMQRSGLVPGDGPGRTDPQTDAAFQVKKFRVLSPLAA